MWPKVRQHPLDHLNSDTTGYLHDVAITTVVEVSRQSTQASLMPFAVPTWDHSKWFDRDKHALLTADACIFIVMVTNNYCSIVIRTPSSFQFVEAIRAAIPTARLVLGGSVGNWDSVDIKRTGISGKERIRRCMCK